MDKVGPSQLPLKLLKTIIEVLEGNYKSTLAYMFIINVHWMLTSIWKIIYKFLDPVAAQKIFLAGKKFPVLYKYVDKKSLELKYGGEKKNLQEGEYFPPKMI